MKKSNFTHASITSVQTQVQNGQDIKYDSNKAKRPIDNRGMDWYNYPLTGKYPV